MSKKTFTNFAPDAAQTVELPSSDLRSVGIPEGMTVSEYTNGIFPTAHSTVYCGACHSRKTLVHCKQHLKDVHAGVGRLPRANARGFLCDVHWMDYRRKRQVNRLFRVLEEISEILSTEDLGLKPTAQELMEDAEMWPRAAHYLSNIRAAFPSETEMTGNSALHLDEHVSQPAKRRRVDGAVDEFQQEPDSPVPSDRPSTPVSASTETSCTAEDDDKKLEEEEVGSSRSQQHVLPSPLDFVLPPLAHPFLHEEFEYSNALTQTSANTLMRAFPEASRPVDSTCCGSIWCCNKTVPERPAREPVVDPAWEAPLFGLEDFPSANSGRLSHSRFH